MLPGFFDFIFAKICGGSAGRTAALPVLTRPMGRRPSGWLFEMGGSESSLLALRGDTGDMGSGGTSSLSVSTSISNSIFISIIDLPLFGDAQAERDC
jgi:hypothetical protein